MIDEKELSAALHRLADRDETEPPAIRHVLRRGRRARVARAATMSVAAVALMTGAVVVAARPHAPEPVSLAAAAQNTASTTFHITFTVTVGDGPTDAYDAIKMEGKYDPVHDVGYLRRPTPGPPDEYRMIGKDCFTLLGDEWERVYDCWRPSTDPKTGGLGISGSPGDLLAELREAGSVTYDGRTVEGSRAVDAFRFGYQLDGQGMAYAASGTVDVDVTTSRIVEVKYREAENRRAPFVQRPAFNVLIRLDDFGTPVHVDRPDHIVK